jgi:hypothetical protein
MICGVIPPPPTAIDQLGFPFGNISQSIREVFSSKCGGARMKIGTWFVLLNGNLYK